MARTRFWMVDESQFLTWRPYTMKSITMPGDAGKGLREYFLQKSTYALRPLRSFFREDLRLDSDRMCIRPRTRRLASARFDASAA